MNETTAQPTKRARFRLAAVCALLLAAHGALVLHHYPPSAVGKGNPLVSVELTFHLAGALEGRDFLAREGRMWGYSPRYMAGYPFGLWNSIGTRGYELSQALLPWLSVEAAFYVWVVLTAFLPPLLIALACGALRLGWGPTAWTTALAVAVWQGDSMLSYFWTSGMIAFPFVESIAVLYAALLYRCWDSRQPAVPLGAGLCLAAIFWLHQLVLLSAGLATLAALWLRRREFTRAVVVRLIVAALLAVALAWPWARALWRFADQRGYMDLARIAGGARALLLDWLSDRRYRFAYDRRELWHVTAALAALGGWSAWRGAERRVALYAAVAPALAVCGYAFGFSRFLDQTEPYRYVGSALLFAIIPAAAGARRLAQWLRDANPAGRAAAAAVLVMLAPNLTAYGFDLRWRLRHPARGSDADQLEIARWIAGRTDLPGRVVCEHVKLANVLPFFTAREVIGGTISDESVLPHNWASVGVRSPIGGRRRETMAAGRLAECLRLFNAALVVTSSADFEADMRTLAGLYTPVKRRGPYTVFAADPASLGWVWEGAAEPATAVRAEPNRIVIEHAPRGSFVLKYHYWSTLASETPGVRLFAQPLLDDPVPWLGVENPRGRETIVIANRY